MSRHPSTDTDGHFCLRFFSMPFGLSLLVLPNEKSKQRERERDARRVDIDTLLSSGRVAQSRRTNENLCARDIGSF